MKSFFTLLILLVLSLNLSAQLERDTIVSGLEQEINRIIAADNLLYFVAGGEIYRYDTEAVNPQAELIIDLEVDLADIVLLGDDLYVTIFFAGRIVKLDVSAANPVIEDVVTGVFNVNGLNQRDSVLYFTRSQAGILASYDLKVASPNVEVLVDAGLRFPGPLTIDGDQIYVSCIVGDSLALVDLAMAAPLTAQPLVSGLARPIGQLQMDDRLFVANSDDNNILIFDTNDFSAAPDTISGFELPGDLTAIGADLYVAQFGQSSQIVRITNGFLLAGEQCGNAESVDNLFGGPENVPQTSGLFDNTGYAVEGDAAMNCFQFDNLDATRWFSFVGDGNSYGIRVPFCDATNPIGNEDSQIILYAGACNELTQVACNDDENGGTFVAGITVNTVAGQPYVFLVDGYTEPGISPEGEFCLEVTNLGVSSTTDLQETALRLFPNPTSGLLRLDQVRAEQVAVFDLTGSRLAEFRRPGDRIDISTLPAGVYVLRIEAEDGQRYAARVIKE